jgi:hypothetical protein
MLSVGLGLGLTALRKSGGVSRPDLAIAQAKGVPFFLHDHAIVSRTFQDVAGTIPADDPAEPVALSISLDPLSRQATQSASNGSRPARQSGGVLRFDGSDDYLAQSLIPAASGTILQRVKFNITGAIQICMGSQNAGSVERCWLGSQNTNTLFGRIGTTDFISSAIATNTAAFGVLAMAWGLSGDTARLYFDGVQIGSVVQTSTLASVTPLHIGALSAAGTATLPAGIDAKQTMYCAAKFTPAEIAQISTYWNSLP